MFPTRVEQESAGADRDLLARVGGGLASLQAEMRAAGVDSPREVAAFLTTMAFESGLDPNAVQAGATGTYRGRGYVQLTGQPNYEAAGRALGVDLVGSPQLASDPQWSAAIACWYWTVARPSTNAYAEALRMGRVNAMIGYQVGDGSEDRRRCEAFAGALKYLTGEVPAGIDCSRS